MKKWFLTLMMILYSTTSFALTPVVIPHGHNKSYHQEMKTDGQEIYKHTLLILVGKEIRGCKIIDAFYWDHKINMICIKGDEIYKMKSQVQDMTDVVQVGWSETRIDADVTKEVIEIFNGKK